ncbi:hypothetical protein EDD11_008454 [Mortierella claussenii]|nr:hypothetical protein EDD11_008454 [Mortierella claussenii]
MNSTYGSDHTDDDENKFGPRYRKARKAERQMNPPFRNSKSSLRREADQFRPQHQHQQQQQQQHQQQPSSQSRIWSENVDLPYILAGYVQVAMNTAFVGALIYIMANFITTVQSDVSFKSEKLLEREIKQMAKCKEEYNTYGCDRPVGPKLVEICDDLRACWDQPLPRIGRGTVAAETVAQMVNVFVNTMSFKTLGFVIVLVFGGLYFSNQVISSYRSNHTINHQHSIVPPAGSGTGPGIGFNPRRLVSKGSSRSENSINNSNNNNNNSSSASSDSGNVLSLRAYQEG